MTRSVLSFVGTLVLAPAAFFLPVIAAELIQSARGVSQHNSFSGLIWASFCCGFVMVIVVGLLGTRLTRRYWTQYIDTDDTGICQRCGYPLTGLAKKAYMCPECGFVIPRATSDASKKDQAD